MKKRILLLTSIFLCVSLFSGCALFPFEEDIPILNSEENTGDDAEKNTEEIQKEQNQKEQNVKRSESEEPEENEDYIREWPDEESADEPRLVLNDAYVKEVLAQAKALAAQYDYDGAIALLQNQRGYEFSSRMKKAVKKYRKTKKSCIDYPLDQITHVFFHTLVVDNSLAFDGDFDEAGYNQYMTTIPEFNRIIESMYKKGYVMVSPHDMAPIDSEGNMTRGSILLPPGKIPFVLSQDDVSYYHYMSDDGFATKLVVDENGEVKAEYIDADGEVLIGDYDMVPLIDSFVKEHPDFSYHGRKGILALTGYNGILGYRTDAAYQTGENLQDDQREFLEQNPDFKYKKEVKAAKKVAKAMKENGWEFASHTWGHKNVSLSSVEELQADNQRWCDNVKPILGDTDMIIFAFGADIGNWDEYTSDNPKYAYYKASGYNYFMNVDSSQYWVQITSRYFRQGRRNLDGYRMYYNPEMLSDLFDVSAVWDSDRPTPVPPIG